MFASKGMRFAPTLFPVQGKITFSVIVVVRFISRACIQHVNNRDPTDGYFS